MRLSPNETKNLCKAVELLTRAQPRVSPADQTRLEKLILSIISRLEWSEK